MKFALLILNSIFYIATARVTRQYSYGLRNVCTAMVSYVFPHNFCLYCLSDVLINEVPFIDYCLKNLNTALVHLNSRRSFRHGKDIPCDGYLIISRNYTMLNNLFTYGNNGDFEFQTQKRILLFYVGESDFLTYPFNDVANTKGNEIIVVDTLPNYHRNLERYISLYKNGLFRAKDDYGDENVTVRVSSVRENKILDVWPFLKRDFDRTKLNFPLWKPNFNKQNDTFKISCFDCDPFFYLDKDNNVIDGIDYQIIKLMTEGWPISFSAHKSSPYGNSFGRIAEEVRTGQVDLAACSIWLKITAERDIDYTQAYSESCYTFLVPKPHLTKQVWFVFHTMRPVVWCLVSSSAILMGILIKFSPKSERDYFNDLVYALLQSIRILSVGPVNRFPKEPHLILSLTLAAWFTISLILTTVYSAGFSSVLTYPSYSEDMRTIKDMIKQNIRWGSVSSFIKDELINSGDPNVVKLANNFIIEQDLSVRSKRIKTNRYAVAAKRVYPEYLTETQYLDDYARRNLQVLQDCYSRNSFVFSLKYNSPYKKILDKRLLRIIQHGLVDCWTNRILSKYNLLYMRQFFTHVKDLTNGYQPLNLGKMQGIFYFLILGYLCAILVFTAECYYDKRLNIINIDIFRRNKKN